MLKSILPLSFIIATRFFGLFIVLPVLSLYALELQGANEFLTGLLIGIYALMQMLFQVPFGVLSDKIGRKKALCLGLVVFIIGSAICAVANDIWIMMIGRALQGSGAVGAVATAMISDFVKEEQRSKAMAIMGACIGLAFALSMVLSPLLSQHFGLASLFWISIVLTVLCIVLLYTAVPKEPKITAKSPKTPILQLLKQKNLALMNLTSFMQKMLIAIAFFIIPLVLVRFDYPKSELWLVYAWAMIAGFWAMGVAGALGERRGLSKLLLLVGVGIFALAFALMSLAFELGAYSVGIFIAGVVVFFVGFNLHEPIMQSVASKFALANERGAALGVFNAFGYGGSFLGGLVSGLAWEFLSMLELTVVLLIIICAWFVLLCFLKSPSDFKNLYLALDTKLDTNALSSHKGIVEIYTNSTQLVIKYDSKIIDEKALKGLLKLF